MTGTMSVNDVQQLVQSLQAKLETAASPAELNALRSQITDARSRIETELSVDSTAVNAAETRQVEFENKFAQSRQTQYSDRAQQAFVEASGVRRDQQADVAGISRLNDLLRIIQGRQVVSANPELERTVAGPLRVLQQRLEALHVPADGIAPMLSTLQQRSIEPERAAAVFMVMRAAVSHESEVPQEHVNEIAANLAVTQLESGLTTQQVQDAFKFYLALSNTTPANAQALTSAYANRLADLATTRSVEVSALTPEDLVTVRDALKGDYDHFVEKTEGDGAIAALLASAVTTHGSRAEVWTQYRFFDEQSGVDSAQAAVLTAGMMARVTDVTQLPQMRTDVMQNYRDMLAMRPPDTMAGTTLSPFVIAGYAGAGLGPRSETVRVINSGPSFTDLMLWSYFMSSHPTYSVGAYSGYNGGYSSSTWSRGSGSSGQVGNSLPGGPAVRSSTFSRMGSTAGFAERATTGTGAIGYERRQLGAGVGRNTTILSSTGSKTLAAPNVVRTPGTTAGTNTAGPSLGRRDLGAGVGRNTSINSAGSNAGSTYRSPSAAPTGGGVGRAGPAATGVSG